MKKNPLKYVFSLIVKNEILKFRIETSNIFTSMNDVESVSNDFSNLSCSKVRKRNLKVNALNLNLNSIQSSPKAMEKNMQGKYVGVFSKVTEFLYVGGASAAKNKEHLSSHRITHIVNCAGGVTPDFYPNEYSYYSIKHLHDHNSQDITCHFYNVIAYIENARKNNGVVFIHCVKGISRSPTIAMAYMIWHANMTFDASYKHLKNARPIVSPNPGFVFQLSEWATMRPTSDQWNTAFRIDVSDTHFDAPQDNPMIVGPITPILESQLKTPSEETSQQCYVFNSKDVAFIWHGSSTSRAHRAAANVAVERLQKYANVSRNTVYTESGNECAIFWQTLQRQNVANV